MGKGVGGKQWEGSVQASLNLSKESTGTIMITIPNQRNQTATKLGSKGFLGLSLQRDLGVFFNEGPKFIHLDLGKLEIPEEHVANLFAMQGGGGQPPPDGIKLDLQDSGGAPKTQALGQQLEPHKNFLFGTSEVEESGPAAAGKGFTTGSAEIESRFTRASGSVSSIGDHVAQSLLSMMLTRWVGAGDVQIFWFWTTSFLRSLDHPLLLSEERIA